MDVLKRRIREHRAFRGGPADETYWLDLMEFALNMFPEGLDHLADLMASVREHHPECWSAYIEASRTDPLAWKVVHNLFRRLRNRPSDSLTASEDEVEKWRDARERLDEWARDVTAGDRVEPTPPGGDSRKQVSRNGTIAATINGIRDLTGLPYESDERRSACHAVAERLGMKYHTVRSIWRNHRGLLKRARQKGLIPPPTKQRRRKRRP